MRLRSRVRLILGITGCLLSTYLWSPGVSYSTNGPQVIGFSAASNALGGSGLVAVADTSALNMNPAALSLLRESRLDVTPVVVDPILEHKDVFSNDVEGQRSPFMFGNLGFAMPSRSIKGLTYGFGVFSQGGFGTDFRNLNTAFGTQDGTSSFLRYVRFAAGASYKVTKSLSIGITPYLGYSDFSVRLFPGTSAPGFAGFGIKDTCARNLGFGSLGGDCPSDLVYGAKIGAMYEVSPELRFGIAYTTPVSFDYDDGKGTLNFSSVGLGLVDYDVKADGFKWAQQLDFSMAAQATDDLLLALTVSWINWDAVNNFTITATNPTNPLAPSNVTLVIPLEWQDQAVVAAGLSYTLWEKPNIEDQFVIRLGYNYSNNPIPNETLSPLTPLIVEHRLSGGIGYRFTPHWSLDASTLYGLSNSVTYTNPSLPFGPNAVERAQAYFVYLTLGYRF